MARPQTVSDEEIVTRIASYLAAREWPASSWSLAEVAPAAGLSPAGLVKRFESRAGLLAALGEQWLAAIPQQPLGVDAPLVELRAFARDTFAAPSSTAAIAGLADLFADLADESRAATLRTGQARQRHYCAQLLGALDQPRISQPERAAEVLLDALYGALIRHAAGDDAAAQTDQLIDYFLEVWA